MYYSIQPLPYVWAFGLSLVFYNYKQCCSEYLTYHIFILLQGCLQGKFLEVRLLGQEVNVHLVLLHTAKFLIGLYHLAFPPAMCICFLKTSLMERIYYISKFLLFRW